MFVCSQSYLTPCDPMGYSPPGSSVHGILQARILPFPSPGDLPHPGVKSRSLALQAHSLPSELPGKPICLKVSGPTCSKESSLVLLNFQGKFNNNNNN